MKIVQFICCVVLSLAVAQAWGAPIFIDVDEDCITTVVDSTGQTCPGKGPQDACRGRGQAVNWVVRPGNNDFEVSFMGDSPFGDETACLTDAGQPCRISDDTADGAYDYEVEITGCGGMDPRILIH